MKIIMCETGWKASCVASWWATDHKTISYRRTTSYNERKRTHTLTRISNISMLACASTLTTVICLRSAPVPVYVCVSLFSLNVCKRPSVGIYLFCGPTHGRTGSSKGSVYNCLYNSHCSDKCWSSVSFRVLSRIKMYHAKEIDCG